MNKTELRKNLSLAILEDKDYDSKPWVFSNEDEYFNSDREEVYKIVEYSKSQNFEITPVEAWNLWQTMSNSWDASWLIVDEYMLNRHWFDLIKEYIEYHLFKEKRNDYHYM